MIPIALIAKNLITLAQAAQQAMYLIYQAQVWIAMYQPVLKAIDEELVKARKGNNNYLIQDLEKKKQLYEALGNAVIIRIVSPVLSSNIANSDQTIAVMNQLFELSGYDKHAYGRAQGIGLQESHNLDRTNFNALADAFKADFDAIVEKLSEKKFKADYQNLNSKDLSALDSSQYRMLLPDEIKLFHADMLLYKHLKEQQYVLGDKATISDWYISPSMADTSKKPHKTLVGERDASVVLKEKVLSDKYSEANENTESALKGIKIMRENLMLFWANTKVQDVQVIHTRIGPQDIVITPALVVSRMQHANEMYLGLPIMRKVLVNLLEPTNLPNLINLESLVQLEEALEFAKVINKVYERQLLLQKEIAVKVQNDKQLHFHVGLDSQGLTKQDVVLMLAVCAFKQDKSRLSVDMNIYRMASLVNPNNLPTIEQADLEAMRDAGLLSSENYRLLSSQAQAGKKGAVFALFNDKVAAMPGAFLGILPEIEQTATKIEYYQESQEKLNLPAMQDYLIQEWGFMIALLGAAALKLAVRSNKDKSHPLHDALIKEHKHLFSPISKDIDAIENHMLDLLEQIQLLGVNIGWDAMTVDELLPHFFSPEDVARILPVIQELEQKQDKKQAAKKDHKKEKDEAGEEEPAPSSPRKADFSTRLENLKPPKLKSAAITIPSSPFYQMLYDRADHKIKKMSIPDADFHASAKHTSSKMSGYDKNKSRFEIATQLLEAMEELVEIQALLDKITALNVELETDSHDLSSIQELLKEVSAEFEAVSKERDDSARKGLKVDSLIEQERQLGAKMHALSEQKANIEKLSSLVLKVGQCIARQDELTEEPKHRLKKPFLDCLNELQTKYKIRELCPPLLIIHLKIKTADQKAAFAEFRAMKSKFQSPKGPSITIQSDLKPGK